MTNTARQILNSVWSWMALRSAGFYNTRDKSGAGWYLICCLDHTIVVFFWGLIGCFDCWEWEDIVVSRQMPNVGGDSVQEGPVFLPSASAIKILMTGQWCWCLDY